MIQFDIKTGAPVREINSDLQRPLVTDKPLPNAALDAEKQYYSFRDQYDNVPYWSGESCGWVVKDKKIQVTAYNKETQETKEFDDESLVTDDYTLLKPSSQYDEWMDETWVTNDQAQYEAQVLQVDATRRSLYLNVDALRNEAAMIRMLCSEERKVEDEAKAQDYEEQAKALYLKIRSENPWPQKK
ncbi:hypothetical protein HC725_06260 [Vibrio sp. S17_S38]|uniref:hypothetical protein n=1 Tax=Vibrio sp. S17_S38 TaxID=2720229 RepID=UPI001680244E|nr:hypothetical protein [Vibrio sp. S17_S38]MBD1572882.1 hypothetical protein [Vibrio sp. S17_S38]